MNIGGDPERDDYDLPSVDIEVPDDASELARDVQAYYRELRARRWHRLARRLRGPLTQGGMVLPLLASCLALTLLAGVTLTMFSADRVLQTPAQPTARAIVRPPTPAPSQAGAGASASASAGASALLPDTTAQVDGKPVRLRTLMPSVLALIPSGCRCATALRQISEQAATAGIRIYLVGTSGWMTEVKALATQNGTEPAYVVDDASDALGSAYHRTGLTAVLVYADGSVSAVRRDLAPGVRLTSSLQVLASNGSASTTPSQRPT